MNTPEGGRKAAVTNKKNWGEDFYQRIGKSGGLALKSKPHGFMTMTHEQIAAAGKLGGQRGRRQPTREVSKTVPCTYCKRKGHVAYDCIQRYDDIARNKRILDKYGVKRRTT